MERNDDEINLCDYIQVLKRHKKLILLIIIVSVAATGIISFLLPPIYESSAVIMPATPQKEQGSMSTIAMQLGISAPSTSNVSEILALLRSNILNERVIKRYNLIPIFFPKDFEKMSDAEKTWGGIEYLQDISKIKYNQKGGIIDLSVEFKDPKTAADILSFILVELTDYMSSEAKRVAETNKKYLESQLDKTSDPFIKTKIYNLIAQQIEQAMMAEVKENFAFKVIDPPKVPDKRTKPKRMLLIIMAFMTSLFVGLVIAFFKEHVKMRATQQNRNK